LKTFKTGKVAYRLDPLWGALQKPEKSPIDWTHYGVRSIDGDSNLLSGKIIGGMPSLGVLKYRISQSKLLLE
jgi:hypothetical protein